MSKKLMRKALAKNVTRTRELLSRRQADARVKAAVTAKAIAAAQRQAGANLEAVFVDVVRNSTAEVQAVIARDTADHILMIEAANEATREFMLQNVLYNYGLDVYSMVVRELDGV